MPSHSPVIRPAVVEDLQRIQEIAIAGWTPIFERYRLIVGDRMWNDVWKGWEKNWFVPDPQRHAGRAIVAELDGQTAGFATWWLHNDEFAEVGGNAVDPKFQGRGVGSRQIRWVVDMFREKGYKCAKVHTGMDPAHGPARAEYRNAGLRRPVTNSLYLNYLDEAARIPARKSIALRWAAPDDRELLTGIIRSAWTPVYDAVRQSLGDDIYRIAMPNPIQKRTDDLLKSLGESPESIRIASENGKPVGFSVLGGEPQKKLGAISGLGVLPEAQGRGIGAALCMDAFEIFRQRGMSYARLHAPLGEVHGKTRQLCWNVGLYRQLPSIDYYMTL